MNWWDFGWWTAARVTAGGQVAGALATAAAVMVALWISLREGARQRTAAHQRLLAQARLVVVQPPRWSRAYSDRPGWNVNSEMANHSASPVIAPMWEVWGPGQNLSDSPAYCETASIILPTAHRGCGFLVGFDQDDAVSWRVSWCDSFGQRWCVAPHHLGQPRIWAQSEDERGRTWR